MQVAEQLPSVEVPHRRRRSRRNRVARNLRRGWRRPRLRRTILTLLLVVFAVVGGYKVSMVVVSHDFMSKEELNSGPKP